MKSSLFYFPDADLYINTGRPPAKFAACCFMILTVASVFADGLFRQRRCLDQPSPPTKVAVPGVLVSVRCTEGPTFLFPSHALTIWKRA
jgi:hypothetical protein